MNAGSRATAAHAPDGIDPQIASRFDRQAGSSRIRPQLEIGQNVQGNQKLGTLWPSDRVESSGPYISSSRETIAARMRLIRIASLTHFVAQERAPKRQPLLADGLASRPATIGMQIGIKIWYRSLCHGLLKGITGSRKA